MEQGMDPKYEYLQSTTTHRNTKRNQFGRKLYNKLPRQTIATLVRLRTDHCGLNYHLYRFNINNSSYCKCGQGKETVEHYLLKYHDYKEQRKKPRKKQDQEE